MAIDLGTLALELDTSGLVRKEQEVNEILDRMCGRLDKFEARAGALAPVVKGTSHPVTLAIDYEDISEGSRVERIVLNGVTYKRVENEPE